MRALFVDQFSEIGGGQRCFLELLPALHECGWEVAAAIPEGGPMFRHLAATHIPCGPYHSGAKNGFDQLRFASDVYRQVRVIACFLRDRRFDLIYVNGPRVLPGAVLGSRRRVPVLFHAHNYLNQRSAAQMAGWSIRASRATVIACSDFVGRQLRQFAPESKIQVVPNGVPDLGFIRRTFQKLWRIGVIGRIEPQKGQAEFLQAARLLQGCRFVICGAPSASCPEYYERVRELARGLPVEFMGWQENMASVYAQLDLVVIPSEQEAFSLVMLEAFSAGVPVIAFAVGGLAEAIVDEESGFLVRESSAEALRTRIESLKQGGASHLQRVASNARTLWEKSYNVTLYRQRMVDCMEQASR